MTIIQIHEFSTGIEFKIIPNSNNWCVEKQTEEEFMNRTLYPIPDVVYQSIDDGLFAIPSFPKSLKGKEFVMIGREVEDEDEAWSIIAVITKRVDSKKKEMLLYRYFLTHGLGKLADILAWFNKNNKPTFNPLDKQSVGYPHHYDNFNISYPDALQRDEYQQLLQDKSSCLVIPHTFKHKPTPIIVNQLAQRRKKQEDLTTWAYNIEKIDNPQNFQVIYPLNSEAEKDIQHQMSSVFSLIKYQIKIGKAKLTKSFQSVQTIFFNLIDNNPFWLIIILMILLLICGPFIAIASSISLFFGFPLAVIFITSLITLFVLDISFTFYLETQLPDSKKAKSFAVYGGIGCLLIALTLGEWFLNYTEPPALLLNPDKSVMVLINSSDSINSSDKINQFEKVKASAINFINDKDRNFTEEQFGIIDLSQKETPLSPLTTDKTQIVLNKEVLDEGINRLEAKGLGSLEQGIKQAITSLSTTSNHRYILLFTHQQFNSEIQKILEKNSDLKPDVHLVVITTNKLNINDEKSNFVFPAINQPIEQAFQQAESLINLINHQHLPPNDQKSIMLLMDLSDEMKDSQLKAVKTAAINFISRRNFAKEQIGISDLEKTITQFEQTTTPLTPLTIDDAQQTLNGKALKARIQNLKIENSQILENGIEQAIASLSTVSNHRYLLLFTDGMPSSKIQALLVAHKARNSKIHLIIITTQKQDVKYLSRLSGDNQLVIDVKIDKNDPLCKDKSPIETAFCKAKFAMDNQHQQLLESEIISNDSLINSALRIGGWTAIVTLGLSLSLMIAQNQYLNRRLATVKETLLIVIGSSLVGFIVGGFGSGLFIVVNNLPSSTLISGGINWGIVGMIMFRTQSSIQTKFTLTFLKNKLISSLIGLFVGIVAVLAWIFTMKYLGEYSRFIPSLILGFSMYLLFYNKKLTYGFAVVILLLAEWLLFPPIHFSSALVIIITWTMLGVMIALGFTYVLIPNLPKNKAVLGGILGGSLGSLGFLISWWFLNQFIPLEIGLEFRLCRFMSALILGFCMGLMIIWKEEHQG